MQQNTIEKRHLGTLYYFHANSYILNKNIRTSQSYLKFRKGLSQTNTFMFSLFLLAKIDVTAPIERPQRPKFFIFLNEGSFYK